MERAPHDTADRIRPARTDGPATLPALRVDFPRYRIWREIIGDRVRYVARRLSAGNGPHTVVAADLSELRAVLSDSPLSSEPVSYGSFSAGAPNIAPDV